MDRIIEDPNLLQITLNNFDKYIKFRSLNRDHNFIFFKIKNSIQIYEPIKLNLIYSLYLNEEIINFEISAKDSTLLVNTKSKIEIYELTSGNLSDYDLKIKFRCKLSKSIDNIENFSISSIGDVIAVIDKHKIIRILNKNLEVLKNLRLEVKFYNSSKFFPLEYFNITYDTKNICLCKYGYKNISLIYRNSQYNSLNDSTPEYEEKIITCKDNIIYLKEMQKDFTSYINYQNSSIFFVMTQNLNFLILRKIFEFDSDTGGVYPNMIILLHIDLTPHTEFINFPFSSFSLLYDNENPYFKSFSNENDYYLQSTSENIKSGIVYPDTWNNYIYKNTLECDSYLMLNSLNHKNVSVDYLMFNFSENLILYKIEGLYSHPYNNLNFGTSCRINADSNFSSKSLLLKMTKTLDRKYCLYFLDENNLVRKFMFNNDKNLENSSIYDSERAFKIYQNIIDSHFNPRIRKTLVLEYDIKLKNSNIILLNSKLELSKIIVIEGCYVKNLKWIENTGFFIFSFDEFDGANGLNGEEKKTASNTNILATFSKSSLISQIPNINNKISNAPSSKIGVIFIFSKLLNRKINFINEEILKSKHTLYDFSTMEGITYALIPKSSMDYKYNQYKYSYKSTNSNSSDNSNPDVKFNKILFIKLDSIARNGPYSYTNTNTPNTNSSNQNLNSIKNQKKSHINSSTFEILLVTDTNIILSEIQIESDSSLSYEKEFSSKLKIKQVEQTSKNTIDGKVIFNTNKLYYSDYNSKLNILSINEISQISSQIIFQLILLDELLYSNTFYNNYFVFVTLSYINCYDVSTRTFYRVRNDQIKTKNFPAACIDLFKFGIFVYLIIILTNEILFIRIPRNKNKFEQFKLQLNYNFDISKNFAKMNLTNNMIILNESQLIRLDSISTTITKLLFDLNKKSLVLMNSNPSSLFDMETFLDFFLSGNEEIVKLILNIFCDLYYKIDRFTENFKNAKSIPNFYNLVNINYLIKIIFENDLNVLSEVGVEAKANNIDDEDFDATAGLEIKKDDKRNSFSIIDVNTSHRLSLKRKKTINLENPPLVFKIEEDNQKTNPIMISCQQNQNIKHLKEIYEVISAENTRNVDNFTKYFILKIKSKSDDLEKKLFKLSTADLCWISLINDQEYLLKFLCKDKNNLNWNFMKMFSIPIWIKSDFKMKELLEIVGRNEYRLAKERENLGDSSDRNYAENAALYFFLAGKQKTVIELFDKESQNEAVKKFIMKDFTNSKNRETARKSAMNLMNRKKYLFAAYFFLLGDDMHTALDVALDNLRDINLAVAMIRMYQSPYGNESWKEHYNINKLFKEYFINYGKTVRDPWLVTYGYLGQKRVDYALEYILNYDINYNFSKEREIMESAETYGNYLDTIGNIYGINVFDYKLLLFAKNLEKYYILQLAEVKKNVKSVQNTNFEDIWDMDDDGGNAATTTQEDTSNTDFHEIAINYDNLAYLCLINSLKRGILYAPIINLYKLNKRTQNLQLDLLSRDLLRNLVCDRIILDALSFKDIRDAEKYLNDIETFFNYLEDNKIFKKKELYGEISKVFVWLDNYQISAIPCHKSNKILETLQTMTNYSEKLISRNLAILINFNFYENLNIKKVSQDILSKIREMSYYISQILRLSDDNKTNSSNLINQNKIIENSDVKFRLLKAEQNLYIFRLIFIYFFYLLFLAKLILSYNKITHIYKTFISLISDYKNLEKFSEKCSKYLELLDKISKKIDIKINEAVSGKKLIFRNEPVSFYVQILNISIMNTIKKFLVDNLEINLCSLSKKFKLNEKFGEAEIDHYIQEQFEFIPLLLSIVNSFIENFEVNLDKYVKNYMDVSDIFDMHEELKMIYMKNLQQSSNFYKYSIIPVKILFKSPEKLSEFEEKFELKYYVTKYMSRVCKDIKYERKKEEVAEINDNTFTDSPTLSLTHSNSINMNLPTEFIKFSRNSIRIINQMFKTGVEVVNFTEGNSIQEFAINNCDVSNISVALLNNGHKKINILNNLLVKKRSDDYFKLFEHEPSKDTSDDLPIKTITPPIDFKFLIEKQLNFRYNELLSIIDDEIVKKTSKYFFGNWGGLPPLIYNEQPSYLYSEDISLNNVTSNTYCKLITSHPLLPLYLTANNRGVLSVWSYGSDSKKAIDNYFIEKVTKETMTKVKNLKKLKFNSYGNQFLTLDKNGNLFIFEFENNKGIKLPKIILPMTSGIASGLHKPSNDAVFLNNSGIVVTTFNKGNSHHTSLLDFLLPLNHSNVSEIDVGGNIITPLTGEKSILIGNDKPGLITFIDIRKMGVVNTFQAHLDEMKSLLVSERENFMVTCGKDGFVKIWDLSLKSNPLLIESFQPFSTVKENTKNHMHLEIVNGLLFASKDGCIKLLRNKIY